MYLDVTKIFTTYTRLLKNIRNFIKKTLFWFIYYLKPLISKGQFTCWYSTVMMSQLYVRNKLEHSDLNLNSVLDGIDKNEGAKLTSQRLLS